MRVEFVGPTIASVRAKHPDWVWRSERDGFGWVYCGEKGDRLVTVVRCTDGWFVYEKGAGENYCAWDGERVRSNRHGCLTRGAGDNE